MEAVIVVVPMRRPRLHLLHHHDDIDKKKRKMMFKSRRKKITFSLYLMPEIIVMDREDFFYGKWPYACMSCIGGCIQSISRIDIDFLMQKSYFQRSGPSL